MKTLRLLLVASALLAPSLFAESKTEHDLRAQLLAQRELIEKMTATQKECAVVRATGSTRHAETLRRVDETASLSAQILAMGMDIRKLVLDAQSSLDRRAAVAKTRDDAALLSQRLNAAMACALVLIFFMLILIFMRQGRHR